LPRLGVNIGRGLVAAILSATIGAVLFLLVIRSVRGDNRWSGAWGRGRRGRW
jgi:hypothetical protein